ncbi:MAG: HAMP domain-containing protein, partial [Armatimonadota bacterium]
MTIRRFFQVVWALFFVLVLAIGVLAALLYVNEENLTTSQKVRFESYLLADELRQSSDDLTRFVRTYVVTGDPKYRKYYWDVLAIRNGVKPRPLHYNRIYWDFVAAGLPVPWPATEAISLQARMSRLGFTDAEFHKLNEAQRNSDALIRRENAAMHAMEGLYDDGTGHFRKRGKPNQALAIRLVHDAAYQREKARVMKPIDDFFAMLDARTASTMDAYAKRGFRYLEFIIAMLLALLLLTLVSSIMIAHRVTAPVMMLEKQTERVAADIDSLAAVAERIAQGSLSETFETTTRPLEISSNDEIGQLSRVQTHMIERLQEAGLSIAKITAELREDAEKLEARNRDLQESYTQLRKLESLRDSLTHMIVHDMRTPVTSIYGYLETLRATEAGCLSN